MAHEHYLDQSARNANISETERYRIILSLQQEFARLGHPKIAAAFEEVQTADLLDSLDRLRNTPTATTGPDPIKPKRSSSRASAPARGRAIKTGEGYFVKTPIDAIMDTRLSHSDLRLLQLVMILAGQKGYCWHAEPTLALMMIGPQQRNTENKPIPAKQGVSLSMIEKGIAKLARTGYLEIVKPEQLAKRGYKHQTIGNTYLVRAELP